MAHLKENLFGKLQSQQHVSYIVAVNYYEANWNTGRKSQIFRMSVVSSTYHVLIIQLPKFYSTVTFGTREK
jgi:hypothetical protein